MKLGPVSQIVIGTKDLEASTLVFDKIGFKRIAEGDKPNPYILYTDESSIILLNQDGIEYLGLIYFNKDMSLVADFLQKAGTEFLQITNDAAGNFYQGIFTTPDGVMINLVNFDASGMYQPTKSLPTMTEQDMLDSTKYPNLKMGAFGEFSIPVRDLKLSVEYWHHLGFNALSLNEQPYPWAIVSDGVNILGLHQTQEFGQQAITYFAPDMKRRIENLKREGLEDNIQGFPGTADNDKNAVLTTMERQKIFLFSI